MKTALAVLILLAPVSALALDAKDLAGTWNVTATSGDTTCQGVAAGAIDANVWLVSVTADGEVNVVAQGNTSFPQLTGKVSAGNGMLTLTSTSLSVSAWFRLAGTDNRTLIGLKRVTASTGNANGFGPCFVDYMLQAKKQ